MAVNCCNWLKKNYKWMEMAGYGLKGLEMARTNWKWLKMSEMPGNCLKCPEMS